MNKIATILTSMLKTTISSHVLINNKLFATNKIGGVEGSDKLIEKSGKLLKTEKLLKDLKLSKLGKLFKSQELSKIRNLPKFAAKEIGSNFLTSNARTTFNYL